MGSFSWFKGFQKRNWEIDLIIFLLILQREIEKKISQTNWMKKVPFANLNNERTHKFLNGLIQHLTFRQRRQLFSLYEMHSNLTIYPLKLFMTYRYLILLHLRHLQQRNFQLIIKLHSISTKASLYFAL